MCKPKQVLLLLFSCLICLYGGTQSSLTSEPTWPSSAEKDWLLDASPFKAGLFKGNSPATISLPIGLVRRTFLGEPNLTTIALGNLMNGENLLRDVKPEASLTLNGKPYKVGGLQGQKNYAFLQSRDLANLSLDEEALSFKRYQVGPIKAPLFYERTGFTLLEHDGSYPGDICTTETHPSYQEYADSRWNQYQVISTFYKWCRSQSIYLNVTDYYYLTGSNKGLLYYTGLNESAKASQEGQKAKDYTLARSDKIKLSVEVPAQTYT